MKEFVLIMKGTRPSDGWEDYIARLSSSGLFRGGSAFGGGLCFDQQNPQGVAESCVVSGFMRFEADTLEQVAALIPGNPVFESGDQVELHELVFG